MAVGTFEEDRDVFGGRAEAGFEGGGEAVVGADEQGVVEVEGDGEVERVVGLGVLASSAVVGEGEGCTVVVVARVCQEQRVKGWL
jgi:hypothetical protein